MTLQQSSLLLQSLSMVYDGIKKPLVYKVFEHAMAKYRTVCAYGKENPRVQRTAVYFVRAIWFSLHGSDIPLSYCQEWRWPSEAAWRLRNEMGEDQGTDISSDGEETLSPSSSSHDSPLHHQAVALPTANPRSTQSELSRDQYRSKSQKIETQETVLTK